MRKISDRIFRNKKQLYTVNLVPGHRVYGEKLKKVEITEPNKPVSKTVEYREWDPNRSKLAAAILNGLQSIPIKNSSIILYLGASAGTTPSHISDIVGTKGIVYSVEFAERVFRIFINLAKKRTNLIPILSDARKPEKYYWVEEVDVLYVDIAQPDEIEISIRNARKFLKKNGYLMIAIKSRSIDVTKNPKKVYKQARKKLEQANFDVIDIIDLKPYEKDHAMIVAVKQF